MRCGTMLAASLLWGGCTDQAGVDVDLGGELDECFVAKEKIALDDSLLGFDAEELVERANERRNGIFTWAAEGSTKIEFSIAPATSEAVVTRLDPDLPQPRPWCGDLRSRMDLEVIAVIRTEDRQFDEKVPALLSALDLPDEPPLLTLESQPLDVRGLAGTWAETSEPDLHMEILSFRVLFDEAFEVWEGGFLWQAHGLVVGRNRQEEASAMAGCGEEGSPCERLVAWWQFQP